MKSCWLVRTRVGAEKNRVEKLKWKCGISALKKKQRNMKSFRLDNSCLDVIISEAGNLIEHFSDWLVSKEVSMRGEVIWKINYRRLFFPGTKCFNHIKDVWLHASPTGVLWFGHFLQLKHQNLLFFFICSPTMLLICHISNNDRTACFFLSLCVPHKPFELFLFVGLLCSEVGSYPLKLVLWLCSDGNIYWS